MLASAAWTEERTTDCPLIAITAARVTASGRESAAGGDGVQEILNWICSRYFPFT